MRKLFHALGLLFAPIIERQGLISVFRILGVLFSMGASGALGGALASWLSSSHVVGALAAAGIALLVLSLFALYRASPLPQLRVFLDEAPPLRKDCGGAPLDLSRMTTTPCLFHNVRVGNESKKTLSGCYGSLIRVDEVQGGNLTKHAEFPYPTPLRWANEEMGVKMEIHPDTPIQLGLVRGVDDPDPVVYIETEGKTPFGKSRTLTPGDYRLTVRADSVDSPHADGVFSVSFSGKWDGIEVAEWHDPAATKRQRLRAWLGRAPGLGS
jgi:hypothetical protein